jgi:hypothetical protein
VKKIKLFDVQKKNIKNIFVSKLYTLKNLNIVLKFIDYTYLELLECNKFEKKIKLKEI